MCGLEDYADAVVGSLGVEQRKRTSIGVELGVEVCPHVLPSNDILIVLWYSLSSFCSWMNLPLGLDSQSAWAIMKFLRDLANNGQAILCT